MVTRVCSFGCLGLALTVISGCPNDITARNILATSGEDDSGSSDDVSSDDGSTSANGVITTADSSGSGGSSTHGHSSAAGTGSSSSDESAESSGGPSICGDGVWGPNEACDAAGESASCDADCTIPECGDGYANASAAEQCDDGGESALCNTDCTLARCGDGKVNPSAGETCDDGKATARCDSDCTSVECGDGVVNAVFGELCDDAGASSSCDEDCTFAECGDLVVNQLAGEMCDDGGVSATCDADCTVAVCGDGVINELAGEQCDDGLPALDGDGCSHLCTDEPPAACDTGTDPFTGDAWVVCDATQTSAWISAGPEGGNYHAQAICEGLGYATVGAIGGNCGSPCSFCEAGSSCDATGLRAFNGGGDCGSDDDGPVLCTTVMWVCSSI